MTSQKLAALIGIASILVSACGSDMTADYQRVANAAAERQANLEAQDGDTAAIEDREANDGSAPAIGRPSIRLQHAGEDQILVYAVADPRNATEFQVVDGVEVPMLEVVIHVQGEAVADDAPFTILRPQNPENGTAFGTLSIDGVEATGTCSGPGGGITASLPDSCWEEDYATNPFAVDAVGVARLHSVHLDSVTTGGF